MANKPSRIKGNPHNKPTLEVERREFRRLRHIFGGSVLLVSKDQKKK